MSVVSLNIDSSKKIDSNKRRESQPKWKNGFLDSKYECPVCNGYLRFPVQFENCQHHTCSSCLPDILRVAPRCPICQQAVTKETIVNDKELQADIFNLEVFCSNKDKSCQWEGTLKNSLVHIDECGFVTVDCQNQCGVKFERRFKEKHEKNDCQNRQVTCEFCQTRMNVAEEVTHLNSCEKFPIPCPNRCGAEQIRRGEMENHLNEVCSKQENPCPFKDCGCDFKGLRAAITQHIKDSPGLHLNLTGKTLIIQKTLLNSYEEKLNEQKKWIESLVKTISNLEKNFGAQYIWKIDQYQERLQEARNNRKTTLFSPPFLTSRHGYRMALSICLCGDGKAKGKYVSLFVCICRGEYDALLPWPFSHRVTFTLLDQSDDVTNRRNITYSVKPNVCKENKPFLGRPVTERNASFGAEKFTDLETLASLQYIRDDAIFIKFELDNEDMVLI